MMLVDVANITCFISVPFFWNSVARPSIALSTGSLEAGCWAVLGLLASARACQTCFVLALCTALLSVVQWSCHLPGRPRQLFQRDDAINSLSSRTCSQWPLEGRQSISIYNRASYLLNCCYQSPTSLAPDKSMTRAPYGLSKYPHYNYGIL